MNHERVGDLWDGNADAWTRLVRDGYDGYRDTFNAPAFAELLPEVDGCRGLDVGCGEGASTRLLAETGAKMVGIDLSEKFVRYCQRAEVEATRDRPIEYQVANAVELPFEDESFDFVTSFMSLMDMPEPERAIAEAFRVLRPGGFLQFVINHPCFDTPHRVNLRDETGEAYAVELADYFEPRDGDVEEWVFSSAPKDVREAVDSFRTPRFRRTLSEWFNLVIDSGFTIERIAEPRPTDEDVEEHPELQDAQVVSYFLHVRARKSE